MAESGSARQQGPRPLTTAGSGRGGAGWAFSQVVSIQKVRTPHKPPAPLLTAANRPCPSRTRVQDRKRYHEARDRTDGKVDLAAKSWLSSDYMIRDRTRALLPYPLTLGNGQASALLCPVQSPLQTPAARRLSARHLPRRAATEMRHPKPSWSRLDSERLRRSTNAKPTADGNGAVRLVLPQMPMSQPMHLRCGHPLLDRTRHRAGGKTRKPPFTFARACARLTMVDSGRVARCEFEVCRSDMSRDHRGLPTVQYFLL